MNWKIFSPKILKYKDQFLSLFRLLLNKTFSKRGFSWSGKLVSSALLTLTHVYPLENKFVNPDEWNSEGKILSGYCYVYWWFLFTEFRSNHHRYWGKLYKPEDIIVSLFPLREPKGLLPLQGLLASSQWLGNRFCYPNIQESRRAHNDHAGRIASRPYATEVRHCNVP